MNLAAVILKTGVERGDKMAVLERGKATRYGDLCDGIMSAASRMSANKVESGDMVAIALPNGSLFLNYLFGSMLIGATAVPIRYEYSVQEIGHIVGNAAPKLVVGDAAWLADKPWLREKLPKGTGIIGLSGREDKVARKAECDVVSKPECPALISYAYTGAGEALGAVHTHGSCAIAGEAYKRHLGMTADDRVLFTLPMPNAFTLAGCVFAPLLAGATLVIENDFTPKVLLRTIEKHKVTILTGVPAIFRLLAACYRPSRYDIGSLRMLITGGDYMPKSDHVEIEKQLGVQMVQGYGLTECFPVLCNRPDETNRPGSLGVTGDDVQLKIVDDRGKKVKPGIVGEILIKSPSMMTGYYRRPEQTARVYDGAWLHTGDLGHVDDKGYVYFDGLKKRLFNVHGNKIDPDEIKGVLLSHPSVREAVVVCENGSMYNGISPKIRARVNVFAGAEVTPAEIKEFCKERVALYKVPSFVEIVAGDHA